MPDYKTMYYKLMGRISDAVELLISAQREGEQAAMEDDKEVAALDGEAERNGTEGQ